jgi:hypothetical protein
VSEKEHPAATAGRYLRAAGIAIKKERERLAAESAAKRAAEAAAAPQQASQAPAQQAVAPAAPAPAAPKRAPRKAPPAPPPNRFLDRLFWLGFMVAAIASALALLNIQMITSGTAQDLVRLVLGGIFLVFAGALLLNVGHAKDRVLATMTKKLWGLEQPTTRMGRFMRSMAKDVLTLLAIAWLAIAVYEILTVVVH